MTIPITTLIGPPRGSPPSTTSWPGFTTLHAVASQAPSGALVSRRPIDSSRGTSTSQSVPDGLRTSSVPFDVSLDPLLDLDGEEELSQPVQLAWPLGDDAADDGRVRVVEPFAHRSVDAHARGRRARECERRERDDEKRFQTSIRSASPCPPPEQIAASPSPPPERRSSWIIVVTIRPPEAPIGCPSATAPPLTLTISSSAPSIRVEFFATEENASLISTRDTSSIVLPAFASACSPARAGVRAR